MPTKPRDTQWGKLVAAQSELGPQPHLDRRELSEFVDRVVRSRWFGAKTSGNRPVVTVEIKRTDRGAYCMADYCTADYWVNGDEFVWNTGPKSADKLHALHMLGHFLTPHHYADHGPQFAHAYVLAVGRWIGSDAEKALREAFRKHRVKTYTWSKEAREKASDRALDRKFRDTGNRLKKLAASLEEEW